MTAAFDDAFRRLIDHEGTYSDDPNDRGNWTSGAVGVGVLKGTKYGIAAHAYPDLDIKSLTFEQAKDIYWRDYWRRAGCDLVPESVAFDLFDFAVNSGPATAVRFLQRSVGVEADGVIGPQTMAAIKGTDPIRLIARLSGARLEYMTNLNAWATQGKGWARRIANNLKEV